MTDERAGLVEKVARAIRREDRSSVGDERRQAQAAISAVFDWMAEPSEDAETAGGETLEGVVWANNTYESDARDCFLAMLATLRREALG